MSILVVGRGGQVSTALAELGCTAIGRPDVDLAIPGSLASAISAARPTVVINAAAYTAVDRAEEEPELAHRINAEAAGEGAAATHRLGARFIQLSTDYVFAGDQSRPYVETDPVAPINVYGRSKLAGEEAVRSACSGATIVRTSWVHSPFGGNFVKTMLELARTRDEIRVVADQRGNPTSALALAEALLRVAASDRGEGGTYHLSGSGEANWAEFAAEIMRLAAKSGLPTAQIIPIAASDWPTPARRPADSRLDCAKFERDFGAGLAPWRDSLAKVVARLAEAG